ncbi:enoyl-CoA delta isomerase 1, mitochondrial-like [Diabrotica virgifera virgifera]|uniref:Enoyl-CoA delta isomerase 1, mitochondrial n=1 Tax=Diabrotica virgifera virgifera TaxID=50390 RepID=A0A6P7FUU9_DIAVI|nr:enoyl-CoA delta isomerase 1, mitochondrial-like [Diabrotica virgifera virgifera]
MALRSVFKTNIVKSGVRCFSKEASFVSVTVNDKNGVATVEMQRPPVNSLNYELLSQLSSTLTDLEKNKSRGLILTSKNDGVFSAGLDILEMYKPDQDRMKAFWTALQDTWIKLYGSSYPTVALINGHAPAGGCLLSLCCEYRVMFKNRTIGLNETQLGIVAPKWFIASMTNVIGNRKTELALTGGVMYTTDEALNMGMIDEIIETKAEGMARAEAFITRFAKISPVARGLTKKYIRGNTIEDMVKNRKEDLDNFVMFSNQPAVQEGLGLYIQSLKKKSKA